jgi:hypothetical protein
MSRLPGRMVGRIHHERAIPDMVLRPTTGCGGKRQTANEVHQVSLFQVFKSRRRDWEQLRKDIHDNLINLCVRGEYSPT